MKIWKTVEKSTRIPPMDWWMFQDFRENLKVRGSAPISGND
jgi:hypothetical protein